MDFYYNIHHHQLNQDQQSIGIQNIIWGIDDLPTRNSDYISIGIHPWHIPPKWEAQLIQLEEACSSRNCLAIGEIGLDRACKTDWNVQLEVFMKQIELAERLQLPVIIHAVRTHADLLSIKKKIKPSLPWILHGYNGNKQSTQQLIKHNFLFSFGERILLNEKLLKLLPHIPPSGLFLETDETMVPIEQVYEQASKQLGLSTPELKTLIHKNFIRIFAPDKT